MFVSSAGFPEFLLYTIIILYDVKFYIYRVMISMHLSHFHQEYNKKYYNLIASFTRFFFKSKLIQLFCNGIVVYEMKC